MTRRTARLLGVLGLLLILLIATLPGYAATPIGQDAVGVFRPTDGTFYLDATGNGAWDGCAIDRCLSLGLAGDIPVVGDWTGTGASAVGVFRPSDGTFYLDYNGNGLWDGCSTDRCLQIGLAGDIPLVGDWNGSSTSKVGLFRPSDGTFYLDYNGNSQWDGCGTDRCLSIGLNGDIPLAGDWSGSGTSKVGAFRPSDGTFYLDYNGSGTWDGCVTDRCLQIGMLGDLPLAGDWSGNGTSKVGVFRPSAGTFYLDYTGNGTWDGCETDRCLPFGGDPTDVPLVGDWTGSGTPTIGVYRRATGVWYLDTNGNGTWDGCAADRCTQLGGEATDHPLIIRVTTVPPKVTALVPSNHNLATGTAGTLTVTIAPAQTTATVVPVSVNTPAVLSVPTSVTVPGNTRTAAVPITALAEGSAIVTAGPLNGTSETATVTVTPPVLTSLALTPAVPARAIGESVAFRATGTYTDGTTWVLTQAVTWTSSDPNVASITSTGGVATAVSPGKTVITAAHPGGLNATTTLTVALALPPAVESVIPSACQVRTTIVLVGMRFGGASLVTFNGIPATFNLLSATHLAATVPDGATTGLITVTTPHGMAASPGAFTVLPSLAINITAPAAGATLTASSVEVRGSLAGAGADVAVSVNGAFAQRSGDQWVVEVPLTVGSNTLTATAVGAKGASAIASIMVTGTAPPPVPLRFQAVPASGVAPLLVRWQVTNETGRPLVQYELDAQGSGAFGPPVNTLDGLLTTYTVPGVVHPVLRATDDQGTAYTAATTVTVESSEDVSARFRGLWDAFKARLMTGDVSGALADVASSLQPRLEGLFQQVGPDLPQLALGLGELTVLSQVGDLTEAFIVEPEGGTAFVYFVQFRRDGLGRWLIEEM